VESLNRGIFEDELTAMTKTAVRLIHSLSTQPERMYMSPKILLPFQFFKTSFLNSCDKERAVRILPFLDMSPVQAQVKWVSLTVIASGN